MSKLAQAVGMMAMLLLNPAMSGRMAHAQERAAIGQDFAGVVPVGDRRIYLECQGAGSPTVLLVSGYRSSARVWSEDFQTTKPTRTMVLQGVAAFTRVCAYDRPGTIAPLGDSVRPSRSDPVAQPRTAEDVVDELGALLTAADVSGPYVLVGHSLGGLFARLFAIHHPQEVAGLVLVDAYSERLQTFLTPAQWRALVRLNVQLGSDTVEAIPGYGSLETLGFGRQNEAMAKAPPLRPMPLSILAHGRPFPMPDPPVSFSGDTLEAALRRANENLATLVPGACFAVAGESGHDIHQDQPGLVIKAIRDVVSAVHRHAVVCLDRP